MNIDNLKCFVLVAENRSFARTAETLYLSQPAVTKQINALEKELGVTLFIRSTRHVELTPAGMSFYKDAKDIVLKTQIAVERLQRQNTNSDTIYIGMSNSVSLSYLSPILAKFHKQFPNIYPIVETPGFKIVLNLFLENKIDILFYYKENMSKHQNISYLELERDYLTCLMPNNHPFTNKEYITLEDLKNESIIACNPLNAPHSTFHFQKALLKAHPQDKIFYCENIEVAHCMVSAGLGISILPNLLTMKSSEFVSIPLKDKNSLSFGIFYHKKNTNTCLKNFIDCLKF